MIGIKEIPRYAAVLAKWIRLNYPMDKQSNIRRYYSDQSKISLSHVDLLSAIRGLMYKGYSVDQILNLG